MDYLHRVFDQEEYRNNEFIVDQEIEMLMEITAFVAGRQLQEGDEKRIRKINVSEPIGCSIILWDGVRKGVMYSGFDFNKALRREEPAKWLMFYVPDEAFIF